MAKTRKSRIIATRPADENHQVLTVTSEGGSSHPHRRKPCKNCPWRRDAIGEFPAEAFRHSANTAYDMSQNTFACHESGAAKPATCAGFLLRGSYHNLSVRIAQVTGRLDLDDVSDGGHDLFDSYREMAIANGVDPDDPVLEPCRD